jgi:N-acetylglutamate synthase-like GNAT family acetyltransferase
VIIYKKFEPEYSQQVSNLLAQLGYNASEKELPDRIKKISENEKGIVFIALENERVVGCVHTMIITRLAEGSCGEIVSLVVDESVRGKGIGKHLIEESVAWLEARRIIKLRVRCNTVREEAHKFYNHLGFAERKSQKVFEKIFKINSEI